MALAAKPDGSFAVLVVCDGVTSAPHSDRAALAAARAACNLTLSGMPTPTTAGVAPAISYWTEVLQSATGEANAAAVGVAHTLGDPVRAALVHIRRRGRRRRADHRRVVRRLARLLAAGRRRGAAADVDHSLGTELLAAGSRAEAEADPAFHTITRWLGADSVEHTPEFASQTIDRPRLAPGVQRRTVELRVRSRRDGDRWSRTLLRAGQRDPVQLADSTRRLGERGGRSRQHHGSAGPLRPVSYCCNEEGTSGG